MLLKRMRVIWLREHALKLAMHRLSRKIDSLSPRIIAAKFGAIMGILYRFEPVIQANMYILHKSRIPFKLAQLGER